MGRSRLAWALGAIAPWQLGAILAVSMPADAGQELMSGASFAPIALRTPAAPDNLIPPQVAGTADARSGLWSSTPSLLREASLSIPDPAPSQRLADEIEPRAERKSGPAGSPSIDRSRKSDPVAGLRPTFEAPLRRPGGLANLRAYELFFDHDENSPVSGFEPGEAADPGSLAVFEPWADGEAPTTAPSTAGASPRQESGAQTMRPASVNERLMQGATPQVRRAEALGSTTPAQADSTPVEVAAVATPPRAEQPDTSAPPRTERPAFAALVERDDAGREQRCLADAIYFEARGESEEGQAAVAQVVLNRAASGLYPSTICGVVYQNRRRHNACQFSFACDGRALRVNEPEAWRTAARIAAEVTAGTTYVSDVGGATHYHANYVRPRWARSLEKMDVIGRHVFYKLRRGET